MGKTAVLIIDVQKALIEANPYRTEEFIQEVKNIADNARKAQVEVIYIRDDEVGEGAKEGWSIYEAVEPKQGEQIFDKAFASAFLETGLEDYLKEKQITDLVIMGMQTEYCIDSTCKNAFELGYGVTIPEGATTTYDNAYMSGEATIAFYEKHIWAGRFAELASEKAVCDMMAREANKGR